MSGTWSPPVNVRHELRLDRVLLVVNGQPWQKLGTREISPAADRYAMVEAAVGTVEGLEASRLEIDRPGLSYTADTLATLLDEDPAASCSSSSAATRPPGCPTWERADEVRSSRPSWSSSAPRPRTAEPPAGWSWVRVEVPRLEVSSTDLRARWPTAARSTTCSRPRSSRRSIASACTSRRRAPTEPKRLDHPPPAGPGGRHGGPHPRPAWAWPSPACRPSRTAPPATTRRRRLPAIPATRPGRAHAHHGGAAARPGGVLAGAWLLSLEPGDDGGSVLLVPTATVVPADGGDGGETTLAEVFRRDGAAAAAQAMGRAVTVAVTEHTEVDDDRWAHLIDPVGQVEVTLDEATGARPAGECGAGARRGRTVPGGPRLGRDRPRPPRPPAVFWNAWLPLVAEAGPDAFPARSARASAGSCWAWRAVGGQRRRCGPPRGGCGRGPADAVVSGVTASCSGPTPRCWASSWPGRSVPGLALLRRPHPVRLLNGT